MKVKKFCKKVLQKIEKESLKKGYIIVKVLPVIYTSWAVVGENSNILREHRVFEVFIFVEKKRYQLARIRKNTELSTI